MAAPSSTGLADACWHASDGGRICTQGGAARIRAAADLKISTLSSSPIPQGKDAISFLEGLVVGDIAGLADGTGSLSVFTNEKGGIIDDTVITKVGVGWVGFGGGRRRCVVCGVSWLRVLVNLVLRSPCLPSILTHPCTRTRPQSRPPGHPHRDLPGGQRRLPREGPGAHREAPQGGKGGRPGPVPACLPRSRPAFPAVCRYTLLRTSAVAISSHRQPDPNRPPNRPQRPPQAAGKDVSMDVHDDRALLALQGPSAAKVLQGMTKQDLSKFYFGNFARFDVAGVPCWVTRTG
jgi:hypothetical protein